MTFLCVSDYDTQRTGSRATGPTYIGHASHVPSSLYALCACADLFFARVLACNEEQYSIEIAALPHYFDADDTTRERHVRTMALSREHLTQLLEYDRRLAAMATCDVIDIVEQHTREQVVETGCTSDVATASLSTTQLRAHGATGDGKAVLMLSESDDVIITTEKLREVVSAEDVFDALNARNSRSPQFTTLLLRAAVRVLMQQQERTHSQTHRAGLACQELELRRVLTFRRFIQPWLDVRPVYSTGNSPHLVGCSVRVAVPLQFVA